MNSIYMERHDTKNNMHRFYQMFVTPGLFDDWSLVKEWGRVGSPGTVRKDWFDCEEAAAIAGQKIRTSKIKKGYQLK
jgi:predicted DNA-binding WGR domain protein